MYIMDNKPIITFSGDKALVSSLETLLEKGIPQESTEWKRSYGRAVKSVFIEAKFIPFSKEILPKDSDWHLTKQPIFHTFWTDCSDVDVYKTSVRDDIENWMKILNQHNIHDWLIVLVETYDVKKTNKLLLRTSVLDKIRSDFASKHADRCLSVINPIRSESRSAESWRGMLTRIRVLVLAAYNRTLIKFEEVIREQRERRNEPGWNFCHYFLLQEELAFVLQMLGLHDEALVQYDELDALFTQFVLNSNVGDTPAWLSDFQKPFDSWSSIVLSKQLDVGRRCLLTECRISLLDFRGYLFSRQSAMLLLLLRPGELAMRALQFLHMCIRELEILEISTPPGAVACWVFLCCLEVLQTCESCPGSTDCDSGDSYPVHAASLWAYARDKLRELGELCGLTPGLEPTSEQLHTVVLLSAGMGDPPPGIKQPTPTDKLKEALSSKEAFRKHYLELAELAMGTFKHIGRFRSARMVGRDLADFYIKMEEPHKASVFLAEAFLQYEEEGWLKLAAETLLELASCYKKTDIVDRFIRTCAKIAGAKDLNCQTRIFYFDEMMSALIKFSSENPVTTQLSDAFQLNRVEIIKASKPIIKHSVVEVEFEVESLLPKVVCCKRASVLVNEVRETLRQSGLPDPRPHEMVSEKKSKQHSEDAKASLKLVDRYIKPEANSEIAQKLAMLEHLDYKQDKNLASASVVAKNPKQFLRRTDSQGKYKKVNAAVKSDFICEFSLDNFTLYPGVNTFVLKGKAQQKGIYQLGQLSLMVEGKLEFLSPIILPRLSFRVVREPSSVSLNKGEKDLLAGLEQEMVLTVSSGSFSIDEGTCIRLRTSRGLCMQLKDSSEPLSNEVTVCLPEAQPFETKSMLMKVLADMPPVKDNTAVEHKVSLHLPWTSEEKNITLHFQPSFKTSCRLYTEHANKFIQIVVCGLNQQMIELKDPELVIKGNKDHSLLSHNPTAGQKLVIKTGLKCSFLWGLVLGDTDDTPPIKTEFSIKYSPIIDPLKRISSPEFKPYSCSFEIKDYKTLYEVKSQVEPLKGNEFCRAGSMCHLQLHVRRINPSSHNSLMYEVLADQTIWAVCGRTAGVISLEDSDKQSVTLDVMPLIGGYLPLPSVRLSKYIPAEKKSPGTKVQGQKNKIDVSPVHPRLEPFSPGQVYNSSSGEQIHVLAAVTPAMLLDSAIHQ
ncbi:trafficking protein particle complex subunit 10 [Schistocerca americana]|uniref:trafficking protein particle complex subunit 10 n=1 Tax=Schistocerca americana TaxID=7009 RepID=UPI001F4F2FC2|nr:trafficking protein particle complex subunit 10 [Schistocerca americana]